MASNINATEKKVHTDDCSRKVKDPYKEASKYIDQNNMIDVLQSLTSSIAKKRPDDPLSFIVEKLMESRTQESMKTPKKD